MAAKAREADLLSAIEAIEGRGRCAIRISSFVGSQLVCAQPSSEPHQRVAVSGSVGIHQQNII